MSLRSAERRRDEGLCVIPGDVDTHDTPAQAEDVYVIAFDTLAGGVMIVAQTDPDSL